MYLIHINLKKTFHDVQFMGDLIMCLDCHCGNFEIDHKLKRTQNTCEVNTIQFLLDTFSTEWVVWVVYMGGILCLKIIS